MHRIFTCHKRYIHCNKRYIHCNNRYIHCNKRYIHCILYNESDQQRWLNSTKKFNRSSVQQNNIPNQNKRKPTEKLSKLKFNRTLSGKGGDDRLISSVCSEHSTSIERIPNSMIIWTDFTRLHRNRWWKMWCK